MSRAADSYSAPDLLQCGDGISSRDYAREMATAFHSQSFSRIPRLHYSSLPVDVYRGEDLDAVFPQEKRHFRDFGDA
jgi:hypothetical protein